MGKSILLNLSEAARRVGVSQPALTKYLQRYPELNRGAPGRPLVDPEELRRHRGENVRLQAEPGLAAGDPDEAANDPPPPTAGAAKRDTGAAIYSIERGRRERIRRMRDELELRERLGGMVPKHEVQEAVHEIMLRTRDRLLESFTDEAERLVRMTDPREIEALLKERQRRILTEFAAEMKSYAEGLQSERAEAFDRVLDTGREPPDDEPDDDA